jgi:hypothetical protein
VHTNCPQEAVKDKTGLVAILFLRSLSIVKLWWIVCNSPYIQTIDDGGVFVVILYLDHTYFLDENLSNSWMKLRGTFI